MRLVSKGFSAPPFSLFKEPLSLAIGSPWPGAYLAALTHLNLSIFFMPKSRFARVTHLRELVTIVLL
jgi:hypothetical protein